MATLLDTLRLTATAAALHTFRQRLCQRMTDHLTARVWAALEHLMEEAGALWEPRAAGPRHSSAVQAQEQVEGGQQGEDGEGQEGAGGYAGAWEGLGFRGVRGSGSGAQEVEVAAIAAAAAATSGSEVDEREECMSNRRKVRGSLA